MKKKILLPVLLIIGYFGFAQEEEKLNMKKVRIFNSSALFLFVGESSDNTKIISQEEFADFDCLKDVNVYSSDEYNAKALWSLKANRKNCGEEVIVTDNDVF